MVGLWYSSIQTRQANDQARQDRALAKEGQVTDRYTAAVANLGEDKMEVRLGGIYALQRIMQDSARDHPSIANVLNTYLRIHTTKPPTKELEPPADVQAALTVLGTRNTEFDDYFVPDLRRVHLRNVDLRNAHLNRANLGGAELTRANLAGAELIRTNLGCTILNPVRPDCAKLIDANLRGANLTKANLSGTDLGSADLVGANLTGANLTGADLTGADLTGAVGLSQKQLDSAHIDNTTRLSAGFH